MCSGTKTVSNLLITDLARFIVFTSVDTHLKRKAMVWTCSNLQRGGVTSYDLASRIRSILGTGAASLCLLRPD